MIKCKKRDGQIVSFKISKIEDAIKKAFDAENKKYDDDIIKTIALKATSNFNDKIKDGFMAKGKNPFSVKSLKVISGYKESLTIAKSKKPAIIISAQGMCEAGRIINHIKHGIENPNNTILLVGYMCEGTLGRKILDKEETVQIDGEDFKLKAEVHKIDAFSAHADYKEILDWLSKIDTSKLKKIFLVHGDEDAQNNLSKVLTDKGYNNEIVRKDTKYKL